MVLYRYIIIVLCLLLQHAEPEIKLSHHKDIKSPDDLGKVTGMTLVAPPDPFQNDPMMDIKGTNSDWVAIVPYAFTRVGDTEVYYNSPRQWWGEREEGALESIRLAHNSGLKVMLKPQVWMSGSWVGDLQYDSDAAWEKWEANYTEYIKAYLCMAEDMEVALFCIGTEFKKSTQQRPQFWRNLIQDARTIFKGKIVYAANWDEYEDISFWEELDYIGVDAYFPLMDKANPSKKQLVKAWQPIAKKLKAISKKNKKPILFTEYGYLSVKGCTHNTWELEKDRDNCIADHKAQATAFDALYEVFYDTDYWHGGFIWKWYPNMSGSRSHFRDKDYTPQGKETIEIISKWYGRD